MTDTLEELTGDTLSREHVERRLSDWQRRIETLYALLTSWLPVGWRAAEPVRHTRMLEEPMRATGMEAAVLPNLDLFKGDRWEIAIVPRSLWIIGVNGRLAVSRPAISRTTHFIVDVAENFEAPKWRLVPDEDRFNPQPLREAAFRAIL